MNIKQRISAVSAFALPALALASFLVVHPTKARAAGQCPDGETYAGEYFEGTCANGEGGFSYDGMPGLFAVCPSGGPGDPQTGNGSGYCISDGCVQCTYSD